jgi:hypothetical protein
MPHESSTGLTFAADPFDFSALPIAVRALDDIACFQQAARHHAFFHQYNNKFCFCIKG